MWKYIKASWAFTKTLLRPLDPIQGWCRKGHTQLKGWDRCPDCDWIELAQRSIYKRRNIKPRLLFYGIRGPHSGGLISLGGREEKIGLSVLDSKIISPAVGHENGEYRLIFEDSSFLLSENSHPFRTNDRESWKEAILDYDEVEISGNRFLALDIGQG